LFLFSNILFAFEYKKEKEIMFVCFILRHFHSIIDRGRGENKTKEKSKH
jgi:hypothetical protein